MNSASAAATSTAPKKRRRKQASVRPTVGTIQERNGAYHWLYYSQGKKVSEKLGRIADLGSKKAACELANERHKNGGGPVRVSTDGVRRSGNILITEYAAQFLEWADAERRPSTSSGYRKIYQAHLEAYFGKRKLHEYQPYMATDFLGSLARGGRLNRTSITHVRAVMSGIFAHAVANGHIAMNPVRDAKLLNKPKKESEETESYTVDEMATILNALDDKATAREHAVMSLAFVGLRRAEIMGLKWADINIADGSLWVRRSAWMGKVNDAPKNSDSVREVTLGKVATESLSRWKRLAPPTINGFTFENENGKPLDLGLFSTRHLRPALKAKGVESLWKGYHSGRRGAETEMQRHTNGNSQITSHHFGHSKEVADAHYTKPLPDETKKAALALDAALSAKLALVANSSQRVQ
jgi:integrase